MFSHTLAVLMGYMAVVFSREAVRPMPTITNSLVNLGKMEVSFYLSGNGRGKILTKYMTLSQKRNVLMFNIPKGLDFKTLWI